MSISNPCWKELNIDNWTAFDVEVKRLEFREWLFRGHHDTKFELKTSLYRMLEDIEGLLKMNNRKISNFLRDEREVILLEKFQSAAHLYINHPLPNERNNYENRLEWNAIMQHYGTPTRLLDVTFSPYIALYFALEKGNSDSCVFAFNHKKIKDFDRNSFKDDDYRKDIFKNRKNSKSFIIPFEPSIKTERLLAQQGLFLVPSTNHQTFDDLLDLYDFNDEVYCIKFLIPAKLRYDGLMMLKRMNITTTSLFPGLEGFCRSLRFEVIDKYKRLKTVN